MKKYLKLQHTNTSLTLHSETGGIESLVYEGVEFISAVKPTGDLFVLRFRDVEGKPSEVSSSNFKLSVTKQKEDGISLFFQNKVDAGLVVKVSVTISGAEGLIWKISLHHERPGYLEWIEFPIMVVPDDFVGQGGQGSLLWPAMEGILVESLSQRNTPANGDFSYKPLEYPNHGWAGYYPGCAAMQFMAYLREGKGVYLASHDSQSTTKEIDYFQKEGGVRLIFKVFPGAIPAGDYTLPYPMVMRPYTGDWLEAAEIYRTWIESSAIPLPPRLTDRKDRDAWLDASPVIVTYPVTGVGHHAGPTQPNEYYPFTNALPVMQNIAQRLDSTILTLLMHWEGTAPWAPPYVWPPLNDGGKGGAENLRAFAEGLHAQGNLLGLYCSGLAWTNTANTGEGGYDRREEFQRDHLIEQMCQGPEGKYACKICNGDDLRYGFDLCVQTPFAEKVISQEAVKMASAGVDYIQLFDQNLGCASYQCHDARHGHPPAPGPWQATAMRRFLGKIKHDLAEAGYGHVRLGCEAAAAEPYIEHLPLNDLRFFIGFAIGRPVPAFAYVFHEYTTNFMGNQCEVMRNFDGAKSPHNLALRLAYSFTAGDLLTVVLKDGGEIHWAWCEKWDVPPPTQDLHWNFIRHLNAWRQGIGKPFLYLGRMLKPQPIEGTFSHPLHLATREILLYPSILTSRWQSSDGRIGQFLVNYLETKQVVRLSQACELHRQPTHTDTPVSLSKNSEIEIAPMTAVLVLEFC